MTEEEKERLRRAKVEVTADLMRINVADYHLDEVDSRLNVYVGEVIGNPGGHNLYEQLAVKRFFRMSEKYGINATEVQRFFTLYEHLTFPGKGGSRCYRLTPVQCFQFAGIYGFWDGGKRVVREAVLFVPRKFSKTTSTAALAVDDLLYGDANAECYTGANSADQAKKCFDVIRGCIRKLDPKGRRYRVNEQTIKSERKDRTAFAQCLTANAKTKDGLNASTVIMDEFSQARDNRLLTVLTTSMGVRDNPLTVIITTASDVFDGPFYEMLQGYKQVLLGEFEDDSLFAHIFEPDIDDAEDNEDTWRKVHPHIGVTVNMDFYRHEYRKAVRDGAEGMLAFRTKLLNLYSENELKSWISAREAREAMTDIDLRALTGKPRGVMAIDLSVRDDFSAVSTAFVDRPNKMMYFHTKYFFPDGALPGHPNERLYRKWAADGHLTLIPGEVIDYDYIVDYVLKVGETVKVVGIGYDAYKSHDCVNKIGNARKGAWEIIRGIPQTIGNFTAPCQAFEHGILTGHIKIDSNPINAYCFGNAVLMYDRMGNQKPEKRRQYQKIDGVITKLMCLRQIIDMDWAKL